MGKELSPVFSMIFLRLGGAEHALPASGYVMTVCRFTQTSNLWSFFFRKFPAFN